MAGTFFNVGIKGLPAPKVEVIHAEVGAIGKGEAFLQHREDFILDVVENTGHSGQPPLKLRYDNRGRVS